MWCLEDIEQIPKFPGSFPLFETLGIITYFFLYLLTYPAIKLLILLRSFLFAPWSIFDSLCFALESQDWPLWTASCGITPLRTSLAHGRPWEEVEQWEERGAGYYFATPVPRSWQHFVVDVLLVFTASLTQSWPHPVPAALGMLRAHCCCQCLVLQDSHLLPYLCPFSFQQSFYKILLFLFWTICGELGFPDGYHSLRGLLCVAGRSHLSFVLFLLLQSDWLRACVQLRQKPSYSLHCEWLLLPDGWLVQGSQTCWQSWPLW